MKAMPTVVQPFVRKSVDVNSTLLATLGERLGLPKDSLQRRHSESEHSGSEARVIHSLPLTPEERESRKAIGAHTDFGSLVSGLLHRSSYSAHNSSTVLPSQSPRRSASSSAGFGEMAIHQGERGLCLHTTYYALTRATIAIAPSRTCNLQSRRRHGALQRRDPAVQHSSRRVR